MRTLVVCASDLCDSTVRCHHYDRSLIRLKCPVQEGEAFDVEHVNFINKKNARNNFCSSFLSPLGNLLINLLSDLWFDFSNVTGKQRHETLSSWVDDINFVQSHCMNHFLSLLKLSLWTLNKSCLGPLVVEITRSRERLSKLRNLSWCFVDCDDVSGHDFLFLNRLDHFVTEVVNGFHFSGFQSNLSCLVAALNWLVDFDFNNFTLYDLGLLSDSHTYQKSKLVSSLMHNIRLFWIWIKMSRSCSTYRLTFWKLEWVLQSWTFQARIFQSLQAW